METIGTNDVSLIALIQFFIDGSIWDIMELRLCGALNSSVLLKELKLNEARTEELKI
jgi:hypothetical protein